MILLTQNILNNVIATVSEKDACPNSSSYYLFEFENDTTKQLSPVILQDFSANVERYNQFSLLVTGSSANALSGSINLSLSGFYQYTIYQGTGSISPTSSFGLNIVETGKMQLLPAVTSSISAFTSSYNPNPVFDPKAYNLP